MLRLWKFTTPSDLDDTLGFNASLLGSETIGSTPREVKLTLACFTGDDRPRYTALSYTWGDITVKRVIEVNKSTLYITTNLSDCLVALLRSGKAKRWFWADQISLDQTNILERNHQVAQMGDIFSQAELVIAWLGQKRKSMSLADALALPSPLSAPEISTSSYRKTSRFLRELSKFRAGISWSVIDGIREVSTDCVVGQVLDMAHRDYWTRLWIIQELRLAKKIQLWCGTRCMSANSFTEAIFHVRDCILALRDIPSLGSEDLLISVVMAPMLNTGLLRRIAVLLNPFTHSAKDLRSILDTSCVAFCSDPRDKVFGIQALVTPYERLTINYKASLRQVVAAAIRTMIINIRSDDLSLGLGSVSDDTIHDITQIQRIGKAIDPSDNTATILTWGALAAAIPPAADLQRVMPNSPHGHKDSKVTWKDLWTTFRAAVQKIEMTKKQRLMSEALVKYVIDTSARETWSTDVCVCVGEACLWKLSKLEKQVARLRHSDHVASTLNNLAAQHGFIMYGQFLAHPNEWPFPDEQPTQTFEHVCDLSSEVGLAT